MISDYDSIYRASLPSARRLFFASYMSSTIENIEEGKTWRGGSRRRRWMQSPCSGGCGALRMKFWSATEVLPIWCSSVSAHVGYPWHSAWGSIWHISRVTAVPIGAVDIIARSHQYRRLARPAGALPLATLADVAILRFAADERFINLDLASQLDERRIFHRGPDALAHVPCRPIAALFRRVLAAYHAVNLQGADALLRVCHQKNDLEPHRQRHVGVLENGAHERREPIAVLVALAALPAPRLRQRRNLLAVATRAARSTASPQASPCTHRRWQTAFQTRLGALSVARCASQFPSASRSRCLP